MCYQNFFYLTKVFILIDYYGFENKGKAVKELQSYFNVNIHPFYTI